MLTERSDDLADLYARECEAAGVEPQFFIEVPTDCPQRDERLGWTGDAQVFIRTATCNMDVAAFFTKPSILPPLMS